MTERTIFESALDFTDPAERSAYLDRACAGDPTLRQRVDALLQSLVEAGSFLAQPAMAPAAGIGDDATEAEEPQPPSPQPGETEAGPACAAAADIFTYLAAPTRPGSLGRLAHYEVLEVLGKGGFGTVFRASDERLHRVVAIKMLAPELAANATARRRFLREARAAAAVRHENIIDIHGVDEQPIPYLVMECVTGQTLQEKIDAAGPLELTEILRIGMQTARGLAAAHAQGLVHRDVKPANILLENGVERVKLTDFGLARSVDDASVTQSGVVAGTPLFMSPEQAAGELVDPRSDLFSLGSVLYGMCTGRPPFRASGTMAVLKRVVEDTPRPVREINPEIPDWLEAIIAKLHAKKPDARFQTAIEVAELLEQALAHLQHPSKVPLPPAIRKLTPRRPKRGSWIRSAVGLAYMQFVQGLLRAKTWQERVAVIGVGCLLLLLALCLLPAYLFFGLSKPTLKVECSEDVDVSVFDDNDRLVRRISLRSPRSFDAMLLARSYPEEVILPPGKYFLSVEGPSASRVEFAKACSKTLFSQNEATLPRHAGLKFPIELGRGASVTFEIVLGRKPEPDRWLQLFNSRDLTGWRTDPHQPGDWKVINGLLVGQGRQSHLFTERTDFADFHLRVELKINRTGDSGVFFRAQQAIAPAKSFPAGYEAQILGTKTGGIMERSDCTKTIESDQWFTLEVIARGKQLTVKINGETTTHLSDEKYSKGCIALQVWGQETIVHFRKVEIKELSP
jgi:serine/threonine protein kinase